MKRIQGLDSIRFVCATFVLLGHVGFPLPAALTGPDAHGILKDIGSLAQLIFNGPAAVIVFFIISGFCIHYPFKDKNKIELLPYYTRRLLRICIPAVIAIIIHTRLKVSFTYPSYGVFWSIICEVVYYIIYPALFYIRKYFDWKYLIMICYAVAIIMLTTHLAVLRVDKNYFSLGLTTWIIGLPVWLMGCWLAENYSTFKILSTTKIFILRSIAVLSVFILRIAKFHLHSILGSNSITLSIFAFIALFWVGSEIMYYQNKKPWAVLEWCGRWSYSIYLIHMSANPLATYLGFGNLVTNHVLLQNIICLAVAFVFYWIVERPSHKFSIYVSSRVQTKS